MKSFKIGDLTIKLPIIQGGMGVGISLSGLASAVANEGGVGVISCAGMGLLYPKFSKDYLTNSIMGLKEEIRKARAKTRGVIGVNVMVALSNFSDMVKTSIAEKADIIFSGAGLPLDLPSYLQRESTTKLVPIVSSARAAKIICEKWKANYDYLPDAIVVEGPKAGGHLGYKNNQIDDANYSLEHIVPEVVAEARHFEKLYGRRIPVIAAGGLYTGGHLYQFPRGRHRNHRQPGRNAGARDRRGIHPPGARRADPSEKVPVPLHQDLRLHQESLLHYHGAVQCGQRQPVPRIRFRRSQCVPVQKDHERPRNDRFATGRVPRSGTAPQTRPAVGITPDRDGRPPVFKTVFGDISYLWVSFLFDTCRLIEI